MEALLIMDIHTYDYVKEKNVKAGWIEGNTFFKKVTRRKHFCWKHSGWGISLDVISELRNNNIRDIVIVEGKKKHKISFNEFILNAVKDLLGHGPQYFINERHLQC